MIAQSFRFSKILVLAFAMLASVQAYAGEVTMNFKNADIRAFIEFVAGFSGKNFLVDNRVKGNVTIISPVAMDQEEAYNVFLSVLDVNGFSTVESGAVTKIVPMAESKQKAIPLMKNNSKNESDEMVTQVLRLEFADAQQLVALIRPLISPNSHLVAYPRGNMLLMTDAASNIHRIQRILALLDRKDAVGVKMYPLKHASADKLAATLAKLYPAAPNSPNSMQAIAHQPGNILVVVADPQQINEVSSLVEKLDIAPESDSGRLQVRYLKFANAVDVAKVVNELVGGQIGAAGQVTSRPLFAGDVKVVAEATTNALLITADPSDISSVNHIVDKLDVRRRQVLVEALIVEISANTTEQFGIEWRGLGNPNNAGRQAFGGTSFTPQGGVNINAVAANPFAAGNGMAVGIIDGTVNFGGNTFVNIGALARALQTKADTNVLSTPNLLTMDNEEAEIIVGQNVPFLTGQNVTTGGTANPFQTIQRQDIGLTLRVKPQISEGDTVRLELYQEISSLDTNAGVQGTDLITNKRSIKTVVLANNSQMIVLGGLIRDDKTASVQRVPCIGALPIIGEPFKFTENQGRKTNLMVFLKPHIIKNADQIQSITNQKYQDIKGLYEEPVEGGTILFPQEKKELPKGMTPAIQPEVDTGNVN
ncbi:MAG: type II secretion system protein GspD [Zetaproteobacteria bacterium CG1_02_49_23]|nr:MAG: type II secretion system protein GspD [Zetaproteobacteria bacterium CG1_02_49_23]